MAVCEPKSFGDVLRKFRERRGLSLRELETRTGIFHSNISGIEADRVPVGPKIYKRLSEALIQTESERLEMDIAFTAALMQKTGKPIQPSVLIMMADILQSSGIDVRRLENLEILEFTPPFTGVEPKKVWFACEHGVRPRPDQKNEVIAQFVREQEKRGLLLVVFAKNKRVSRFWIEQTTLS